MANTTLTQTGAQVQADLNKVEGLANIKSVGAGLTLTNEGEIQANGKLYLHKVSIYNGTDSNTYTYRFLSDTATPMYYTPKVESPYYEGNVNDFKISGSGAYLAMPIFGGEMTYSVMIMYGYWIINRQIVDVENNNVFKNDIIT